MDESPRPAMPDRDGAPVAQPALGDDLRRILELGRWTPSGDNTQPWRFEPRGSDRLRVHARSSAEHGVYDLEGLANRLAIGALLETLDIGASTVGRRLVVLDVGAGTDAPVLDLRFDAAPGRAADPLATAVERRAVQRRAMSTRPLTAAQKQALAASLPPGYAVAWHEGTLARWRMARFAFASAHIRLTIPEAYAVHRHVIDWGRRYSEQRIPEQALGVDRYSARFMRWALHSWERIRFLNTWCLGHLLPRIQMDLLPGLRCGAHFALYAPGARRCPDEDYAAGRALQRFWLTVTALGWHLQPQMTPVLFTRYVRHGRRFTEVGAARQRAERLNQVLLRIVAPRDVETLFFLGRVGAGPAPVARSLRRPLAELLAPAQDGAPDPP